MNLGETIYRLRTKQGMSQDALANELDVSRQSVSKWENNSAVPELEKLMKMSDLFGVTLDALVGRNAPTPPPPAAVPTQSTPPRRIVGIIFLCFGLLTTLILSILGGFFLGVLTGLPITLVGCVLISNSTQPFFHAAWGLFAIYAPSASLLILNMFGFGGVPILIALGIWFSVMVVWSVILLRRKALSTASRKIVVALMLLGLILTAIMAIACSRPTVQSATEELETQVLELD